MNLDPIFVDGSKTPDSQRLVSTTGNAADNRLSDSISDVPTNYAASPFPA